MLPELDFKRSWGMDKAMYFDKKLKEFFVKNRDVKEPISRHNAQTLQLVRTSKENLHIQRRKFGLLFHVAINMKDQETIGHTRVIHGSIKEQLRMLDSLDGYLRNVRIDEKWANAIKEFVCDKVDERCQRLEKNILPDLIKFSVVNIYAHYLSLNGTTLEQDIIDHMEEDDAVYYEHIMSTIEMCKETLPADDIAKLESIRLEHVAAQARRKAVVDKEKKQAKLEKRQDFEKDAIVMLQNWATDTVEIEQRANSQRNQLLYNTVFRRLEVLNDRLTGEDLTFTLIAIAKYNTQNRISTSAFRWLRTTQTGGYTLAAGFGGAEPFFVSLEPEKYEQAIKYCEEQGYIVATVECEVTGKKDEHIIYDYYQSVPEIKLKRHHGFYDNPLVDRAAYTHRLFHDALCALQCVYVIREAYMIYGDATHPINQNLNLKLIRAHMYEILEFDKCWEDIDLFKRSKEEDCKPTRVRMSTLKGVIGRKLQQSLNFPLVDESGQWIEIIKSIVNLNSYTEEDLEPLYAVLEGLNQTQSIPEEFNVVMERRSKREEIRYCRKSDGEYRKGYKTTYGWRYDKVKFMEYIYAYLSYHEPIFTKELFEKVAND